MRSNGQFPCLPIPSVIHGQRQQAAVYTAIAAHIPAPLPALPPAAGCRGAARSGRASHSTHQHCRCAAASASVPRAALHTVQHQAYSCISSAASMPLPAAALLPPLLLRCKPAPLPGQSGAEPASRPCAAQPLLPSLPPPCSPSAARSGPVPLAAPHSPPSSRRSSS